MGKALRVKAFEAASAGEAAEEDGVGLPPDLRRVEAEAEQVYEASHDVGPNEAWRLAGPIRALARAIAAVTDPALEVELSRELSFVVDAMRDGKARAVARAANQLTWVMATHADHSCPAALFLCLEPALRDFELALQDDDLREAWGALGRIEAVWNVLAAEPTISRADEAAEFSKRVVQLRSALTRRQRRRAARGTAHQSSPRFDRRPSAHL